MESIIYEDSPLADYLEGSGEAPPVDPNPSFDSAPSTDRKDAAFAPSNSSTAFARYRKRIPAALKLHHRSTSKTLARLPHACMNAVNGRLGQRDNTAFLERFRYIVIASDLLNEHRQSYPKPDTGSDAKELVESEKARPVFSTNGVFGIAGSAFVAAASLAWARNVAGRLNLTYAIVLLLLIVAGGVLGYAFVRRKLLQHVRIQATHALASLTASAQAFDAALAVSVTIIQEVELVSRGYRLSSPLPPVSRMDDQKEQRRCARLRGAARRAIAKVLTPMAQAANKLEKETVQADLERYHDINEITRSQVAEIEKLCYDTSQDQDDDAESLKSLRLSMQQLFVARKLFLCDLLALDADGSPRDLPRWALVLRTLQDLSSRMGDSAAMLDALLSDEERFATSAASKLPLTPNRETAKVQIRKLGALSSGIRGIQAKMHIIREEADWHLEKADDAGDLGAKLMTQYEAIGVELKALLQEWEEGKVALSASNNKRASTSSAGLLSPRAETPTSWSGASATSGSPADALRCLNGDILTQMDATSSDEEVFEAIAIPRQRSTLTREERLVKMRDERDQKEKARESRMASTNMLRELETVLKHKPAKEANRRGSVM